MMATPFNNHKQARATHSIFALAVTLCAVIIAALLLSSTIPIHNDILPKDDYSQSLISNHTLQDGEPYPINKSKIIRRRRLSLSSSSSSNLPSCPKLVNPRPPPQLPSIPNLLQTSTYAASFPGSGHKLITKHLVESITGMLVGEASNSPTLERMKVQKMDRTGFARGQGEVVALRTSFPHTFGSLAAWDDYLSRAFVVLRNPMYAIPCYFDQLYEMNSHRLPSSSSSSATQNSEETRAAWIKWRDNEFTNQLLLYRRFVSFWMEKYLGRDDKRIYVSYESLVDEETGAQEAVRLATFLEGGVRASALDMSPNDPVIAEAVKMSFVDIEEVPCVWKDIVHATISDGKTTTTRGSHNFSFHGGGDSSSATDRPFTPENLAAISGMLLELMNRWGSHQRLLGILSGYHQEVLNAQEQPYQQQQVLPAAGATSVIIGQQPHQRVQQDVFVPGGALIDANGNFVNDNLIGDDHDQQVQHPAQNFAAENYNAPGTINADIENGPRDDTNVATVGDDDDSLDLFSEDPLHNDSRNFGFKKEIPSGLFTDEEEKALASLEGQVNYIRL